MQISNMFKPCSRRDFLQHAAGSAMAAAVEPTLGLAEVKQPLLDQDGPSFGPIRAFYQSLTAEQRQRLCYTWDHRGFTGLPLRLHVTNNWDISPATISTFTLEQQQIIDDIIASVMNPGWPERLKQQARDDTGRPWGNQKIALFGTPGQGPCQCVITGFHLTLRATCARFPEVAFHGAICHGHQPSGFNERVGHPDNIFWYQAIVANRVYTALDQQQRQQALITRGMPYFEFNGRIDRQIIYPDSKLRYALEPDVRFRGPNGTFPGLPIRDMTRDQKATVRQALTGVLEPYRPEYREQVLRCLARQGGLEACNMAFYQEHDLGNDGEWDNWRIEGPSFVWYFRGFPHVHIWIHVAEDPATPVTSHFG